MNANHLAAMAGEFEPQRTNHFQITFQGPTGINPADSDLIRLTMDAGFLPSESSNEIELAFLNEKRYVAGSVSFEAGSITLKDMVDRDTAGAIVRWRQKVYEPLSGAVGFAAVYKCEGRITLLSPTGLELRQWRIVGAWPQSVNYGTLDMGSDDNVKIECSIRYDKAIPLFAGTGSVADGVANIGLSNLSSLVN